MPFELFLVFVYLICAGPFVVLPAYSLLRRRSSAPVWIFIYSTGVLSLISGNVPTHWDWRSGPTLIILGRVIHTYFAKVEGHVFCQSIVVAGSPGGHGTDKYLLQFNLAVFDRFLPGFLDS